MNESGHRSCSQLDVAPIASTTLCRNSAFELKHMNFIFVRLARPSIFTKNCISLALSRFGGLEVNT
jgi:hypothetical protein